MLTPPSSPSPLFFLAGTDAGIFELIGTNSRERDRKREEQESEEKRREEEHKVLEKEEREKETGTMGRKKIQITRIMDERNRQVKPLGDGEDG